MQPDTDDVFKYVPTACRVHEVTKDGVTKEVQPTFKGHVILRQPTMQERYGRLSACENLRSEGKNAAFLMEIVDATKDFWVSVDIERIRNGKKFDSFEAMCKDPRCDLLIFEIAQMFMDGFDDDGLGN